MRKELLPNVHVHNRLDYSQCLVVPHRHALKTLWGIPFQFAKEPQIKTSITTSIYQKAISHQRLLTIRNRCKWNCSETYTSPLHLIIYIAGSLSPGLKGSPGIFSTPYLPNGSWKEGRKKPQNWLSCTNSLRVRRIFHKTIFNCNQQTDIKRAAIRCWQP